MVTSGMIQELEVAEMVREGRGWGGRKGGWKVRREDGRKGDVYQIPSGKDQHVVHCSIQCQLSNRPHSFLLVQEPSSYVVPGLKYEGRYNLCLIIGIVWYMCLFCLVMAASPPPHTHLHISRWLSPRDVCGSSLVMESLNVS